MRAEGSVNIAAHRPGRDIDPGEAHIVLGKTCHGIEIHFLDVGVRHLGVVAEMEPQLIGVVVAGQPELGEARHDRLIDDLDDVGLGFLRHHASYRCTVVAHWNISVARAVIAHHFWQIEFHCQTGTIARQRDTVAVDDLAAHGGQAHADLRTVPEARSILLAASHLHIPKFSGQQQHGGQYQRGEDRNAEFIGASVHRVRCWPPRPRRGIPAGRSLKKK